MPPAAGALLQTPPGGIIPPNPLEGGAKGRPREPYQFIREALEVIFPSLPSGRRRDGKRGGMIG